MAIADNRQRIMPMPEDRQPGRSQKLDYSEAVRLTNPINAALRGEVRKESPFELSFHAVNSSDQARSI